MGFREMGIKRGLMNIRGNFMSMVKIIVEAGVSVGGTESIRLKDENEKAANSNPGIKSKRFMLFQSSRKMIPNSNGTVENILPKRKELHTFPRSIVLMEMGQVIKRSRVFCRVSQGNTTGPMDVEVRNSTIVIRPEIIYIGSISLPTVNAKKSMIGNNIPCMTTGPLL